MGTVLGDEETTTSNGPFVLLAPTAVDALTAHAFRLQLHDALDRYRHVIVDLSGVERFDATAAAVLVGATRRAAATSRQLSIASVSPTASQVLSSCGLDGWLRAVFPATAA
jgi:anti-anti-sigma factor